MMTVRIPWRLRWRRRLRSLFWTLALTAALAILWMTNRPPQYGGSMMFASDGDSFTLSRDNASVPVRLLGIDAPELGQTCPDVRGQQWPCGTGARAALLSFAPRGTALICTTAGKDKFNRALSRCKFGDGRDLAAQLVGDGWAIATNEDYLVEEDRARSARSGIWQGDFQTPAEWRAAHPRSNLVIPPPSSAPISIQPVAPARPTSAPAG